MHGITRIILQLQQIQRLPHKMNLMIDLYRIKNVFYNTRSNKHHPPTSPNIAPITQNDFYNYYPSHMKSYLQCREQQDIFSNITK